jgi:hypothetical protein
MDMLYGENVYALEQVVVCHSMISETFVVCDTVIAPLRHQSCYKLSVCVTVRIRRPNY